MGGVSMARYFNVTVGHNSTITEEIFVAHKSVDWQCRVNGEVFQYRIIKGVMGSLRNWFERGTTEVQYHAKNEARGGFILWDKRLKNPAKLSASKKAIQEKMRTLL